MARRIVSDSEDDSDIPLGATLNANGVKANGNVVAPAVNGKRKLSVSAEDAQTVSSSTTCLHPQTSPCVRSGCPVFYSYFPSWDDGASLFDKGTNYDSVYVSPNDPRKEETVRPLRRRNTRPNPPKSTMPAQTYPRTTTPR